jgi:hypothetical protein
VSFAGLLTHPLAIVTPTAPDPNVTDEWGHVVPGADIVERVNGLVQPKTAREIDLSTQNGAELSTHTIFLLPRQVSGAAYIRDEPDSGRRFDITGVRSFEYGSQPHLEVDCKLVGGPVGPSVPAGS